MDICVQLYLNICRLIISAMYVHTLSKFSYLLYIQLNVVALLSYCVMGRSFCRYHGGIKQWVRGVAAILCHT